MNAGSDVPRSFTQESREGVVLVNMRRFSEAIMGYMQDSKNVGWLAALLETYEIADSNRDEHDASYGRIPIVESRAHRGYKRYSQSVEGSQGFLNHASMRTEHKLQVPHGYKMPPINFHRQIRHHLFAEEWYDVDMKSSHPSIYRCVCKRYGIATPMLDSYCSDKKPFVEAVMQHCSNKVSPDDVKQLPIRILNDGGYGGARFNEQTGQVERCGWVSGLFEQQPPVVLEGDELTPPAVVRALQKEIKRTALALVQVPEIAKELAVLAAIPSRNPDASPLKLLARLMQTHEARIEDAAMDACRAAGWETQLYMYDGHLVHRDSAPPEQVLQVCSAAALSVGFQISYELKEMQLNRAWLGVADSVPRHVIEEVKSAWQAQRAAGMECYADPRASIEQRAQALKNLARDMLRIGYAASKTQFEYAHTKIIRGGMYAFITPDGEIDAVTPSKLKDMYEHLKVLVPTTKIIRGKEVQVMVEKTFISKWMNDPDIRLSISMDFAPPPIKVGPGVFNTFQGFAIEKNVPCPVDLDALPEHVRRRVLRGLEVYLYHLLLLTDNVQEHADAFERWLAHLFQRPGEKCTRLFLLRGKMGAGKNSIFELLIKPMLGGYYKQTSSMDRVMGKHSNVFVDALLIVMDEANFSDSVKYVEALKDLITSDTRRYEQKCHDERTVRNLARLVATSNNMNPLVVDEHNRRVQVFDASDDRVGDKAYFFELADLFSDPLVQRAVFDRLMSLDISDYDCKTRDGIVQTAALTEMQGCNMPKIQRFAAELCWNLREDIMLLMERQATEDKKDKKKDKKKGEDEGIGFCNGRWKLLPGVPVRIHLENDWAREQYNNAETMKALGLKPNTNPVGPVAFGKEWSRLPGFKFSKIGPNDKRLAGCVIDVRQLWTACTQMGYPKAEEWFFSCEIGYAFAQKKEQSDSL